MKKSFLILTGTLLILSSVGLGCYFSKQGQGEENAFNWSKPFKSSISKKVVATGIIKPKTEVNVKTVVSGVVEELYVKPGELVKKGQKVAKIKVVPNQVNVNTAQSEVELSRLRLDEATRNLKQQKLVLSRNLDVVSFKNNADAAKEKEQRYDELFKNGIVSNEELEAVQLEKDLKVTEYENALINSENNLQQFQTDVAVKKYQLESAINNLQLIKDGISEKSNQIANIITSTTDGMVLDIPIEVGSSVIERNNFNEGTTIVNIADMNSLIFEGMIDEADVEKLNTGMGLELTIGAIEDETFTAYLEFIAPKGVSVDGAIKFEIIAMIQKDKKRMLRAGYSATANVILDNHEDVWSVKERDILLDEGLVYVEVQNGEGQPEKKAIELGLSDGINVEVVTAGVDSTLYIKTQ